MKLKNYCVSPIKLFMIVLLSIAILAYSKADTGNIKMIERNVSPTNSKTDNSGFTMVKKGQIKKIPSDNKKEPIIDNKNIMQINQQMGKIAYELMAIDNKDSYFFSPVSLYLALAVFRPGTSDIAYKELNQKLIPSGMSEDEFNQSLKQIISELSGQKNFALKNKSLVIIDDHQEFNNNYIEDSTQLGADLIAMDFLKNAATATKHLNKWVAKETNNLINPLFNQALSADTILLLINTLYFKDDWQNTFEPKLSRKDKFYTQNKVIRKDFMSQTSSYQYAENKNWQYISMAYKNGATMEIYLPRENLTPKDILPEVLEQQNYSLEKKSKTNQALPIEIQKVTLTLPKFTQENEITLNELLKKSGIKQIFKRDGTAGLDNFVKKSKDPLTVNQVLQKTKVIVDEKGTEAAAATTISLVAAYFDEQAEPPKIMTVNRPFIYQIKYQGILLFIGQYNGN